MNNRTKYIIGEDTRKSGGGLRQGLCMVCYDALAIYNTIFFIGDIVL